MNPLTVTPETRAELARLAAVVRAENPHLETWILGYLSANPLTRYTYEFWYKPEDRPFTWRGKRGPAEK